MPPSVTPAEERLMAAYRESALTIARQLQDASPRTRAMVLRRIDSLLAELDNLSAEWIKQELPLRFQDGSDEAIAKLRVMSGFGGAIDDTFGTLHTEALNALAQDAAQKFGVAIQNVKNEAASVFRKAQKQQVVDQLIQGEIAGEANPAARVKKVLRDQGVTGFRARNGRTITLEDYASMVTHTVLADAHNTGASTRYLSNGVQFARVIERADAPDRPCQWMRGKIISLGDARLLNPYHPWCMGGLAPVLGKPDDAIMSADDPRIPADVRKMLLRNR